MSSPSRVEEMFFEALEKQTAEERAACLDQACGADAALRCQVERLLEAHPQAKGFLAQPAVDREPGFNGSQPPPAPAPGKERRLGDYRILREIGRGGMGVVYEAEQVSLGRQVALKVLPGQVAQDRLALERFRREAKSAARLHHSNIVPVYEVGRDGEVAYYAMQFIEGQGLDKVIDDLARLRDPGRKPGIAQGPGPTVAAAVPGAGDPALGRIAESLLNGRFATEGAVPSTGVRPTDPTGPAETEPLARDATHTSDFSLADPKRAGLGLTTASGPSAVLLGSSQGSSAHLSGRRSRFFRSVAQIGRQAAQGLAYAHASGIVHRDIKPSNLLLDHAGVVWIADFGLAKGEDQGLTHTGDVLGTLRYMAPERFRGEGDARADVYALGLTLYELLTLRPAFDSSDRLRLIEQIKIEEPLRPRAVDARIPRDLETIVLKAIEKDPKARYQTAEAIAEDLRRFLADEPIRARQVSARERYWRWARRNPAIAVLGAVLTALLVAVTVGSLLTAGRFAILAERQGNLAAAERWARLEADLARKAAETSHAESQAETYRATLSEAKALRAGHQLGWREAALADLARLAVMPTPRRDLVELRTEAVASIGEFGVKEVARFDATGDPNDPVYSLDFSPDSRTLATVSGKGTLDLWDVPSRQHARRLVDMSGMSPNYASKAIGGHVRFLPDGELAYVDASRHLVFLGISGRQSARLPIERGTAKALKLGTDRQGRRLAVGWDDGRIDLHDAGTGALQRSFDWKNPWDFALSPDGKWLALQSRDAAIRVVSTTGQGPSFSVICRRGYYPALAFSPNGATLASVDGGNVALWDLVSKQAALSLSGHRESVSALAFSPDGSLVASSCGDSLTRIWDAHDGRPVAVLPGPWYMRRLTFSPDSEYLAASSESGLVCLYQLEGRLEQQRLVGHKFGALCLSFHPRLPYLASASDDHAIIIWDARSGRPVRRWIGNVEQSGLTYSPDGSLLASSIGTDQGKLRFSVQLWDAESGTQTKLLSGHEADVCALAFAPSGNWLASGDKDGAVILWDVQSGRVLRREKEGSSPVASVVFQDRGRQLLVGLDQGEISLFNLERPEPPRHIVLPNGCKALVVDRHSNRAILGDSKGTVIALSLPDLSVVHRLAQGHDGSVITIALSPDGRLLASSGMDRRVVLRDSMTFEVLFTFPAWTGVVRGGIL